MKHSSFVVCPFDVTRYSTPAQCQEYVDSLPTHEITLSGTLLMEPEASMHYVKMLIAKAIANGTIDAMAHRTLVRDYELIAHETHIAPEYIFGVQPIAQLPSGFTEQDMLLLKDYERIRKAHKGVLYIGAQNSVRMNNIAGVLLRNYYHVGMYTVAQVLTQYYANRYSVEYFYRRTLVNNVILDMHSDIEGSSSNGRSELWHEFLQSCIQYKQYYLTVCVPSVSILRDLVPYEYFCTMIDKFYIVT